MVTLDVVAVRLERLSEHIEALDAEQQTLAALVRQLVDRDTPEGWLRTGKACALLRVAKSTLYGWERQGLIGRHHDSIGEVVWDREELLRVRAGLYKCKREHRSRPTPDR